MNRKFLDRHFDIGQPPYPWRKTDFGTIINMFLGIKGRNNQDLENNLAYLTTEKSSFALSQFFELDASLFRYIAFDWAAYILPKGGNMYKRKTDDQAIQLIVGFEDAQGTQRSSCLSLKVIRQ